MWQLSGTDLERISQEIACLPPLVLVQDGNALRHLSPPPSLNAPTDHATEAGGIGGGKEEQTEGSSHVAGQLVLNIDQGMLALMVSNIWALSTRDMEVRHRQNAATQPEQEAVTMCDTSHHHQLLPLLLLPLLLVSLDPELIPSCASRSLIVYFFTV